MHMRDAAQVWEACLMATILSSAMAGPDWTPKQAALMTQWAAKVSPANALPEYPRPQLVRDRWLCLNGLWDFAIQPKTADSCQRYDKRILVPFPVESALSGVMEPVAPDQRVWYRRTFEVPADWQDKRILLHFGAVDWETTVWVNGREFGSHRGGYDPFTFDITDALRAGEQEITVAVWDPTDAGRQPRGKQIRNPHAIWYAPTTGIWQTVWLEPVSRARIEDLRIAADPASGEVQIRVSKDHLPDSHELIAVVKDGDRNIARAAGDAELTLKIDNPRLWSPDDPFLYDLALTVAPKAGGEPTDQATSYFGVRSVSVKPDAHGVQRLFLNGEPLMMVGPLDQGFWPDGLYTAPTDDALRYDIEITKRLGFNTARKHVKIEPARWYYWCDKLGLLVWQDMPSSEPFILPKDGDLDRPADEVRQFEQELRQMIATFRNHPSIVMWVVFNEGWGQHDTKRYVDLVRALDPTRLINAASGWTDRGVGDVHDIHHYPGPACPPPSKGRAAVLGEFGGLGLTVEGHLWLADKNWSYHSYPSSAALNDAYERLLRATWVLSGQEGLAAAIYTQTTDVEREINGLLSYDRAVVKVDEQRIRAANEQAIAAPPHVEVLLKDGRAGGATWRYATKAPGENRQQPDFPAADAWQTGVTGFGKEGTHGIAPRTKWDSPDIWLRRELNLDAPPRTPHLWLYHDEDCEAYVNGRRVAAEAGFVTSYQCLPIPADAFRAGKNTIAVHCRQTSGGQGVDVGLIDVQTEP